MASHRKLLSPIFWSKWSVCAVNWHFTKKTLTQHQFVHALSGVGGDVWRWLCGHVHRRISAHANGGPSGGSHVRRPGSKDPHRRERKFCTSFNEAWSLAIVCMHFVSNIFAFGQAEQFCIFCCPGFTSDHYLAQHMYYAVMPLNCNTACYPGLFIGLES